MQAHRRTLSIAAALAMLGASSAFAQAAPVLSRPLRIIVGFPPGGSADMLARVLAQQLSGVAPAVIIDNKPGAGGRIALEALRNSEADGTTLVLTPASMVVVYPHIYRKLPYDPVADLQPVARVAAAPFVVAVGTMVPPEVDSLPAFIRRSKANPARAAYGTSGAGSIPHFTGVALGKSAALDWTHVAYKGAAPALNDLLGGQIAANISVMSNALPHIQGGKLRPLAISAAQRSPQLPQVPSFNELGFKEATAVEWFGVFAPGKTPPDIVQRLSQAIVAAARTKPFQDALAKGAFDPFGPDTPAAFAGTVKSDLALWGQVVKQSGFSPED